MSKSRMHAVNKEANPVTTKKKHGKWTGGRREHLTPGQWIVNTSRFGEKDAAFQIVCTSRFVQKRRKILITVAQIASISVTLIGVTGAVDMMVSWKFTLIQRFGILANCNEFTLT